MALTFDSTTDRLARTASLPNEASFTILGWARRDSTPGAFRTLCGISSATASPSNAIELGWNSSNVLYITTYGGGGDSATFTTPAQGDWFFFALVGSAAGLGGTAGYIGTTTGTTLQSNTAVTPVMTPAVIWVGDNGWGEGGSFTLDGLQIYDRALSSAELHEQWRVRRPLFPSSLNIWLPMLDNTSTTTQAADYSGNGRNATATTLATSTATAPVSWGGRIIVPGFVAAASGAITGSSSLVFGAGSSTLTGSGALAGGAALVLTGSAALLGSGALAGASGIVLTHAGTLSGTGALAGSSALTLSPSATLVGSGALAGAAGLVFDATLAREGGIAGATALVFSNSASLTGSGALAGSSAIIFGGSATLSGAGALAGTSSAVFALSATADLPAGDISGTSAMTFGAAPALTGTGALAGVSAMAFATSLDNTPQTTRSRVGGPRRRNYIYKGKRYHNLTPDELMRLIAADAIDIAREDIKVVYKGKKPHKIAKDAWAELQETIKSLDAIRPAEIPDADDDEEIEAILALL